MAISVATPVYDRKNESVGQYYFFFNVFLSVLLFLCLNFQTVSLVKKKTS